MTHPAPPASSPLTTLASVLLLAAFMAVGCGGVFVDAHRVDAAILRWTGR